MKKEIKILGAGISGMSAAINLAKAGYNVKIYEKNNSVGKRFNGDFQGLENWSKDIDILKELKSMNIEINFKYSPMKEMDLFDYEGKRYEIKTKRPTYIIKRGDKKDCLDFTLLQQCKKLGVRVIFNSKISEEDVDIIAKGPKTISGIAIGITFDSDNPKNYYSAIFDDSIANKGYAYLFIINKKGCIISVLRKDFKNSKDYLKNTIKKFKEIYPKLKIKNPKQMSGYMNCFLLKDYTYKNKLIVGETAGLQDFMWGFGMRCAFVSGYLAARSIIENKDYNELIKDIIPYVKCSIVNRFLYEIPGNKGYKFLLNNLDKSENLIKFFHKIIFIFFFKKFYKVF